MLNLQSRTTRPGMPRRALPYRRGASTIPQTLALRMFIC